MINHNKAYILGLITGGGKIDKNTFIIELPFKKWGMNPKKMNIIAIDILQRVSKLFFKEYKINVTYEIGNNKWFIKPLNDENYSEIIQDLVELNLPSIGYPLNTANLSRCKEVLSGINAEMFLTGIFDARASITLSHRRFNSSAPVVSIEIPGSTKNFQFVVQLCSWLTDLGSTTDQILYNHPNQHSASDPTYKGWKKGFKIRFLVKSFLANHSFALRAKSIDIKSIEKYQKTDEQDGCPFRKIRKPSPVSVHDNINSNSLPIEVQNKLYFHYFHFCAALGCKYAPKLEVNKLISKKNKFISFFPRLSKGTVEEKTEQFEEIKQFFFTQCETISLSIEIKKILSPNSEYKNYYGLEQGLAFLVANELNGKRHKGPMKEIITSNEEEKLTIIKFKELNEEPILIKNMTKNRAIICSNINSPTNQKLINQKIRTTGFDIELI